MNCECPHCFHLFTDVDDDPQRRYRCPDCAVVLKLIQTETGPALESATLLLEFNSKKLFTKWFLATAIAAFLGYIVTHVFGWFILNFALMFDNGNFGNFSLNILIYRLHTFSSLCIYGCFIAIAQQKVLRNIAPPFQKWFWFSVGAYVLTAIIAASFNMNSANIPFLGQFFATNRFYMMIPFIFQCMFFGALVGVAQWLLLRQVTKRASWWIIACAGSSTLAIVSYLINAYYIEFNQAFYGDWTYTMITLVAEAVQTILGECLLLGLVLVWLLKQPVARYSVIESR